MNCSISLDCDEKPRLIRRADRVPAEGFALVVDSRMKAEFDDDASALKAENGLKAKYPMLQIQIYCAATQERRLVG